MVKFVVVNVILATSINQHVKYQIFSKPQIKTLKTLPGALPEIRNGGANLGV